MSQAVFVTVSALDGGHLTLPERLFVTDADPEKRATVPSLSFLVQHPSPQTSTDSGRKSTNLLFDLGVKRDIESYTGAQQAHIAQRQPVTTDPDCAASLRRGVASNRIEEHDRGPLLDPAKEIDIVILSHVHWDHIGTPSDFPNATFAVGSGTLDLLKNGAGPLYPAELFNDDELPRSCTVEFPPVPRNNYGAALHVPKHTATTLSTQTKLPPLAQEWAWRPLAGFPAVLDFFGDESLFVIDSPGHMYGHVNLLARVGERRYVYLGGDCCHDPRILRGEKDIALYDNGRGGVRSVHVDTGTAKRTLDRIRSFVHGESMGEGTEVEVVMAHDGVWREQTAIGFGLEAYNHLNLP